jgi:hypothetical protein
MPLLELALGMIYLGDRLVMMLGVEAKAALSFGKLDAGKEGGTVEFLFFFLFLASFLFFKQEFLSVSKHLLCFQKGLFSGIEVGLWDFCLFNGIINIEGSI